MRGGKDMKIRNIGNNQTEVETETATILVSYQTPVAACLNDGTGFVRTNKKWSKTTSRHINKWLGGERAREVDQSVLDNMG
jgi:hypothetical protein